MRRLIVAIALIAITILPLVGPNRAQGNPVDPRTRVEQREREVRELEKVLSALQNSIADRLARLDTIEKDLQATETKLQAATRDLGQSEARLHILSRSLGARVRSVYMRGMSSYLEGLLNAESFGDLIINLAYLRRILTRDAELIAVVRQEQAATRLNLSTLAAERTRLTSLHERREAEQRNLRSQRQEQERVLRAAKTSLAADLALITPQAERRPVYAVVLDNIAQARPQHGLAAASMVYEYEVEGRITRYLALFSSLPHKVGPIRSARSHSAMLALENGTHYIYSSGGVDVLDLLRDWNVEGTNALRSNSASFTRDATRRAPHNLFVNLATLGQAEQSTEVTLRPAYLSAKGEPAGQVLIEYAANHRIAYTFVPEKGAYRRYINDVIHRDASGTIIMARNIIIQHVPHGTDLFNRPTPNLIGEGPLDFYALGQHFRGTWRKASAAARTRFFFDDGREIELIYGQTWVQIVRQR
ncbi:MAG: putative lipoprotein YerB [Firmicutes bacterium]|nr:putative lipoprotein YerB [Bacillota bacterium]